MLAKWSLPLLLLWKLHAPIGGGFKKDGTHVGKILNCRIAMANQQMCEYKDYYFKPLSSVVVCYPSLF